MIGSIQFRPEAETELEESYQWYEAQRPGLGEDFLSCIEATVSQAKRVFAVVGAGASVVLDASWENFVSARIGLGAVAATPLFAEEASNLLAGRPVDDAAISEAMKAAQKIATPITDMRGTVEFRLHLTGVLTRRALEKAIERARSK